MGEMEVNASLVSCGCNRCVNAAAWGPSNLVAFAAHNSVAIFCPQRAKIVWTLPGHKDLVNCVEWLPKYQTLQEDGRMLEEHYLLSGSADGVIILWGYHHKENKWRSVMQVPNTHEKAVSCITGLMCSPYEALFASCSSDCTVRVWSASLPSSSEGQCKVSFLQSIATGLRAVVAVSLALLPDSADEVLLAMGGLDNHIHLYHGMKDEHFVPACILKGHQDWVRSLDFSLNIPDIGGGQSIFLASSGQDRNIRIWRIGTKTNNVKRTERDELKEQGLSIKMYIEGPVFKSGSILYQASMESLLTGHDDWVYSVKWQPPLPKLTGDALRKDTGNVSPMSILSASMDRTMMIWHPDSLTGLWVNGVTVGELGHTALGFYGGLWGPSGDSILAHAYGGSFHLWRDVGMQTPDWQPQLVPSGHSGFVADIAWARNGQFLLSTSHDQTTRLYAPWDWNKLGESKACSWHEIARPQVHGHDLHCLAVIQGAGNHQYVSGAEEKVARVFEAPAAFLKSLEYTMGHTDYENQESAVRSEDVKVLGAHMSALGLSQKPIYSSGSQGTRNADLNSESLETIPDALPTVLTKPPLEEHLGWNTLWPESHKLYGHGNELFSMCCDHHGHLLATACKAQSSNVAEIWLWQVHSWRAVKKLHSHSLTVTQMEFSHDDKFLLSVSRDRHFSLFQKMEKGDNMVDEQFTYELVSRVEAHKRIIWACSWSPCDRFFATCSRDKNVKIWTVYDGESGSAAKQIGVLPLFESSVTAVAWAPCTVGEDYLLGVGMEDGLIEIWKLKSVRAKTVDEKAAPSMVAFEISHLLRFSMHMCHVASINRLAWTMSGSMHKTQADDTSILESMQLASCGADHTVRIFSFKGR